MFEPDADADPVNMYAGPEFGLYMDHHARTGLLSNIQRTDEYAEGNVIAGWEPYMDEMAPDHLSMHMVLFTYRPIDPCQPLILWEHLKTGEDMDSE